MIKKALPLFKEIHFFCFSVIIFILAQKSYPLNPTPGVVVLPFSIDSTLTEVRNSLTDHLIQKLKDAGYNAIGTRYLSSVLKMGPCDSDECMRKIASLVGARYVVSGSVTGDTNSYKVSVNFMDLMESKVLLTTNRLLNGAQASTYYADELTLLILQSLNNGDSLLSSTDTASSDLPLSVQDSTTDSTSDIQPQEAHCCDSSVSEESDSTVSDTADSKAVLAENTENTIPVEKALELESDSNPIPEENVSVIKPELNQKTDTASTNHDNIASSTVPAEVYIPPIEPKKTIFKPLPRRLNQQFFRGTRLLVFGNTALVGLIGGLVMNDRVKKGLDKEIELYRQHENADRNHLSSTYQSYKRQTEKTDRDARIRNVMYAVSGVCAVGFSISIFF
jgi:TolB-like protein